MTEINKTTTIEWISPDETLPQSGQKILVLLPHMMLPPRKGWLEIKECVVAPNGYTLVSDDEVLDWEVEDIMWWAEQPDWMDSPGWVKKD